MTSHESEPDFPRLQPVTLKPVRFTAPELTAIDPIATHYTAQAREAGVPEYLIDGLVRYLAFGNRPGSFLRAVLSNQLREAFQRGDVEAIAGLGALVGFLFESVPFASWGSPEQVDAWIAGGGLAGGR